MSTLERKAISSMKIIKDICESMTIAKKESFQIKKERIIAECNFILQEHEARKLRLGEKENLCKDNK